VDVPPFSIDDKSFSMNADGKGSKCTLIHVVTYMDSNQ
jgi:hypothetical protein